MNLPYKETMYNKHGQLIDACPFIFNVELDELDNFYNVKLTIKPLDPAVLIARDYYDFKNKHVGADHLDAYVNNIFYNDEDDELYINVFNGFDVAIFNICSLLGIGRIELDDYVPYNENGFAPVHDKVSRIFFTLEGFKMLDGFVAWFKFTKHFILFKGLVLGNNYIHENACDGSVPHYFSEGDMISRGEKLFLVD